MPTESDYSLHHVFTVNRERLHRRLRGLRDLGNMKYKSPLLALIPNTFEEHLDFLSRDPTTLPREMQRALRLHKKLILRKHQQVGAALRAIASIGRYWTEETSQQDRQYWTHSASMMPGLTAKELWDAYSRRTAGSSDQVIQ